jgi:hypothetical protein
LTQVGGLMTFSHRVPVDEDYDQDYPIVDITLNVPWDPQAHYDDGGTLILPEINQTILAQLVQQLPASHTIAPIFGDIPHRWHLAESFIIRADSGSAPSSFVTMEFQDTLNVLPEKVVYGDAFHLKLNWDQMASRREGPPSHLVLFTRSGHVDQFLRDSSYEEILSFIPPSPAEDTYVFAVTLVEDFRDMLVDPSALWFADDDDGDVYMDARSSFASMEKGGSTNSCDASRSCK